MPNLQAYHKPTSLADALALLNRETQRTVPLAGGTWLSPRIGKTAHAGAVVDLSELGLDQIDRDPDTLRLGAMATLAAVAEDVTCRTLAGGILAQIALSDATVNVGNGATVGGTVALALPDSEFVLALLALDAELSVQSNGVGTWLLDSFLDNPTGLLDGALITQIRVTLPLHATAGRARVSRTPSDHPIVAAIAVIAEAKDALRIALGGVANRPLLVTFERAADVEAAVRKAIELSPPYADWQGTVEYRREMGILLAVRAFKKAAAKGLDGEEIR